VSARAVLHAVRDRAVRVAAGGAVIPIENPNREILLIRPDHLGDVLLLQPAVEWVRSFVGSDRLVLMTGPWSALVARHALPVDEVIEFPFPGFQRATARRPLEPYRLLRQAAGLVRRRAPRAAIVLRDDHWWGAWMARQAGVPSRFGHDHSVVRPHLTRVLTTESRHWVTRNLEVLRASLHALGYSIPAPDSPQDELHLSWTPDERAAGDAARLIERERSDVSYAVVHPGSGAPVKLWPASRWAALADALAEEYGLIVVLTGSEAERSLTGAISSRARSPIVDLAGQTSLPVLAELFRGARIVAGVDSGPLHLAVATGTPTVHLYGPSEIGAYGPWGDPRRHAVVTMGIRCPRCGDLSPERPEGCGCMVGITSANVLAAVDRVLRDDE
jgi:heptosyltransferase III